MTQTELRAKLKELTADLPPPRTTREGYDKPDGRERIVHVVRVLRSVLPVKRSA